MNYEFWEVRAEITAQIPTRAHLPITILECGAGGKISLHR